MNIEKTISEHAVSDILTPMLESQDRIVTEDVAPLFDQATGLDTPPASGTVTTTIEESRSVITAIIRKAWTATLTMLGGASVLSSIAAAYTYLRNRLQGNETYGIPDRRSEISASSPLAANLALLNDRKIGGVPEAEDGISMSHILFDSSLNITELLDDNVWGDFGSPSKISSLASMLPSLETLHIGCKKLTASVSLNLTTIKDLWFDNCEEALNFSLSGGCYYHVPKLKKVTTTSIVLNGWVNPDGDVDWPEVESVNSQRVAWTGGYPTRVLAPKLTDFYNTEGIFQASSVLPTTMMIFGAVTRFPGRFIQQNSNNLMSNLMHLEFGAGTAISLNLSQWGAENCLDTEDHKALFLSNFRSYIALRLTDNGSGKTLTLSQAVFSEIWDSQGQPQVKGDGLDELRADIHRIIRTDKQWAVNKA